MRRLWLYRLLALMQGRRLDRELDEEVQAHLELAERDARAAGLSPEEARLAARRHFGGIDRMREEHRDWRSVRWIETLLKDVRYGLALLVRAPGFTAVTVGVLALGIGANAAMFSLLDAVLLKPLPFPEPDRIVRVWEAPQPGVVNATSVPDFLDWRRLGTTFEALSAEQSISVALTGTGEAMRIPGKAVTAHYFNVFATRARLGRTFIERDEQRAAPVVVLSHAAWQTYFGADPHILQRQPILDGEAHQVIGVLPPGVFDRDPAEIWTLLVFTPEQRVRQVHWLTVHGRLREEVSLGQARQQMRAIHAALVDVTSAYERNATIVVQRLDRLLVGASLRQSIVLAFGAAAIVLLIACANAANLLMARGAARRKELAVRAALGAGRGRLVAQFLTESAVLALLGGAAGVALAFVLIRVASPMLSESLPYTADVGLDLRVLAFAAAAALGVAMLVGTFPALQANVNDLLQSLNQAARGSSGAQGRVRRTVVVGEVALSLMLICGAFLLLQSLFNLQRLETGARIDDIVTMSIDLPTRDYPAPQRAAGFYESIAERLDAVPGVARVALSTHLPLEWINNGERLFIDGVDQGAVRFKRVDPGYFEAFDIPIVSGRGLTHRDREGAPRVVVINEALARRLGDVARMKDAVGQTVSLTSPAYAEEDPAKAAFEIVGVIRSERVDAPWQPDPPVVYVPLAQVPARGVKLVVRTEPDATAIMPSIRDAVGQVDANLPLGDVATMGQVRAQTLSGARRPALVIGAFAAVAALLAALGLYGVLAYAVTLQRGEIGIRMALGAQPRDVLAQVLRSALAMVAVGLVLGLVGVFTLTRLMGSLLFQVSPVDPLVLTLGCASMIAVGLLAGLIPAWRAAGVDPLAVLHEQG